MSSIVYERDESDLPGELLVEVTDNDGDITPALVKAVSTVAGVDVREVGTFRVVAP